MSTLPAAGYIENAARTNAEMKVALEAIRDIMAENIGGGARTELTIATGAVTPAEGSGGGIFKLDTEGNAATDTLDTVTQTNTRDGQIIILMAENVSRVVTLNHAAGGAGQLLLSDSADYVFASLSAWIAFRRDGTDWVELCRGYAGGDYGWHDYLRVAAVPAHNTLCPHSRLRIDYATAATATVAADAVVLSDSSGRLKRFASLSETLNIANTGANGRDVVDNAGAEQASAWYHLWAIGQDDGTLDVFATQACYPGSATSIYARLPAGYTWAGYIGAAYNDGSSNLIEFYQRGDSAIRTKSTVLSGGTAGSATLISLTAAVPVTAREVFGDAYELSTSGSGGGNFTLQPGTSGAGQVNFFSPITSTGNGMGGPFSLPLRTAQQIYYLKSGSVEVYVFVGGWRF